MSKGFEKTSFKFSPRDCFFFTSDKTTLCNMCTSEHPRKGLRTLDPFLGRLACTHNAALSDSFSFRNLISTHPNPLNLERARACQDLKRSGRSVPCLHIGA